MLFFPLQLLYYITLLFNIILLTHKITHIYYLFYIYRGQDITNYTMHFDSFLKLVNAFSYRSDTNAKIHLAFLLYDFNEDSFISNVDIECMLHVALGEAALHPQQYQQISSEVMEEVDLDGNRTLNEIEFSRILGRIPDMAERLTVDIDGIK